MCTCYSCGSMQLWFYSLLSVISGAYPMGFLRKNRIKIIIAFDLPFTRDTAGWFHYLFGLGPTN